MKSFFTKRSCLSRQEIKQYVRGGHTGPQAHRIERHLLECPLCASAVEGYESTGFTEADETALEAIRQPPFLRRRRMISQRRINWVAAAVLLALGTLALWQYQAATRHQRLFAQYFQAAQPTYLNFRGASGTSPFAGNPDFKAAAQLYQAGSYAESITFFERSMEAHPQDTQIQYLFANALLGAWKPARAKSILQQLQGRTDEAQDVSWYLALAHLQKAETDSTVAILKQTPFSGPLGLKSEKLIQQLEE